MRIGYDKPLYVLPFDHRASFSKELFGWNGALSSEQIAEIAAVKFIIFDAAKAAVAVGVPKHRTGILVDEQFGAAILHDSRDEGVITACPAEKSGQQEFDFEYGADFARHIEEFNPTFCKVLVRYNPEGDKAMNRRQSARLRTLSDYLHASGRLYMFELLVPPTSAELQRLGGDKKAYDLELRPTLMVQSDSRTTRGRGRAGCLENRRHSTGRRIARRSWWRPRRAGRDKVGCIVLGRHEGDEEVRHWLTTAASVPGFIGFAVGRTSFWDPLVDYRAKKIPRETAVARIAASFRGWVNVFENPHSDERSTVAEVTNHLV